jgi:tetratricopeptide (TPR) repeat protein
VQSLVQARLDHLPAADRLALQAASVLGQRFAPDALAHLLDRPTHDCANLVRHLLVRPIGDEFLFGHALIRDGVYDSLLRSRRTALHLRAAEWFATRDLALRAEHLDRAQDPGAPEAYLDAAHRQLATYRYDAALALAERGLAIARTREQIFGLTCLRGEILHDLGAMIEARDAYGAALEAANDDAQRCRAWLGLAAVKRVTDDLDGAFADLDRAEAVAARLGLDAELARVHFLRGNLHFPRGEIEGCLAEHEKSLQLAREVGSPELEAQALGGLGDAEYVRGRMISSHRHLQHCVELAAQHGLGRIEVANRSQIAHASLYFQPNEEVLGQALSAAEAAKRVGHQRAELNARMAAVFAAAALGAFDRLREQADEARAIVDRIGARRFLQPSLLYLGRAELAEGRGDEALALVEEALAISRETGIGFHGPNILGGLAAVTPDPDERRRALAEGEQIIGRGCVAHNHLRFYPDAIATMLDLGDWGEAERYADALEAFTRPEPLPWSDFFVARGRALAAFGRGHGDEDGRRELKRLEAEAHRLHYRTALPAIEQVLAGF